MKNRALVTGCAGFIGSHVVDLLIENGFEVIGIDDMSTGKDENLSNHENFTFIKGDIRNLSLFNMIKEVDYVFHLAALARIQPSIEDPITSHNVNLTGTLNVLEYCRRNKAKIIFSSSSSIYEGAEPEQGIPTPELGKQDPKSPYALQKLQSEQYIELYSQLYELDYTILRYFNVYGERQITEGAYSAIVGIFLNQKEAGKKLTVTNDGEQRRDFTYVKDVAMANLLASKWPRTTVNVGTGKNYSVNELAKRVGGEIEYIGERQGEARLTLADNRLAKSLGWNPNVDIMEWVDDQIQSIV